MSKEAALAFRDKVTEAPDLQAKVRRAIEGGESLDEAVRLGKQHGYDFTAEEAQQALDEVSSGELSPFELEMVAGGKGGKKPAPPPPGFDKISGHAAPRKFRGW